MVIINVIWIYTMRCGVMCIWVCLVLQGWFVRIGVHWWGVRNQNYINVWFQNVNILHICAYYQTRHHFYHHSNHHLCNRRTYKEEINQCPWCDILFWNIKIFHFGFFLVWDLGNWYSMLLTWIVYLCPRCQWHYCFLREIWFVCYWFHLVSCFW